MRVGIYKIGQSTRSGGHRARDLNYTVGTETPKMFKCIFEERTDDCGRAEKAVHVVVSERVRIIEDTSNGTVRVIGGTLLPGKATFGTLKIEANGRLFNIPVNLQ